MQLQSYQGCGWKAPEMCIAATQIRGMCSVGRRTLFGTVTPICPPTAPGRPLASFPSGVLHDFFCNVEPMTDHPTFPTASLAPEWLDAMKVERWYRVSGNRPDLGLPATRRGTRYLRDGDPACDRVLNPARRPYAVLRRLAGRYVPAPWSGRVGFPAITEAWNGAVLATRFGDSGSLIVFGGGHNNYFGSDVHAFDLATREWRRISDGFTQGRPEDYGAGALYRNAEYPDGSPLPPHTYGYVQYDAVGNDYLILKGNSELVRTSRPLPFRTCSTSIAFNGVAARDTLRRF